MPPTFTVQPRSLACVGNMEIENYQSYSSTEKTPDKADTAENIRLLISITESLEKLNAELNKLDNAIKQQTQSTPPP